MPFNVTFLSASLPLTKTIEKLSDGTIFKTPYPLIANFTSETIEVKNIQEFHAALLHRATAKRKPCLLKGRITRDLISESRKGTTVTNDKTQWVCLDIDNARFSSPDEVMRALGLDDISYVVQYSSSYKLENKNLSCHIFFLLDRPISAPELKAWLMHMNLSVTALESNITLSKSNAALHWPLDITTCQNDKLLYIAMPVFKNIAPPITEDERIQLVLRKKPELAVARLELKPIENLKQQAREKLNALRTTAGIKPIKATKMVGEFEVQAGVGEVTRYEIFDCGEYVRLNLNGGDSQAYWHHKSDPTYLHNFKGEPSLLLKEVLPHYYGDLVRNAKTASTTPNAQGDDILAFRDKVTAAYWKGTWNPETFELELHSVKSELQLAHFLQSRGKALGSFVPEYHLTFDPQNPEVVNHVDKVVNTFVPTELMRLGKKAKKGTFPTIQRVIDSAVGVGEVREHFMNWLAVVWQQRVKPITAWVLHGTQGCLAGETEIFFRRGKRNAGRPVTIKEAYEKWTGQYRMGTGRGKSWDLSIPTYARCVKDSLTVGYNEVFQIVESGVKKLYRVLSEDGSLIRVTHEHPFMREDGSFTKLCDLRPGDYVLMRGQELTRVSTKGRSKRRVTIHSVPHHPYGWQHIIGGKNYKRIHRARAVWEANMNGLSLKEFVHILRHDPKSAMMLQYLPPSLVVHHLDEDCANDALENLTTVSKDNHDRYHAKHVGLGTVPTVARKILSITEDGEEMTYDMTMKVPYHNYVANNFCVSNTGKGVLFHNVLRPLFGRYAVQKRATELNSQFNGWMEQALIAFIDEVNADMFIEAKKVESDLKSMITEPTQSIRRMRTDSYEVYNYTAFIFSSNEKRPVSIPPGDRRFNIGRFQEHKLQITRKEIDGIAGELEAFARFLSEYKASFEQASSILQTEDRIEIQRRSITSIDELANALIKGDLMQLWDSMPDEKLMEETGLVDVQGQAYSQLIRRISWEAESDLTRDELELIFRQCVGKVPEGKQKFVAYLRHHGLNMRRLRLGNDLTYGYRVTWRVRPEDKALLKEMLAPTKKLSRVK